MRSDRPEPEDGGEGERPPRLALLAMVAFPFLLALGLALLYGWLTR